jgi:FMN phosphatase YigB (HAD superfamily)
MSLRAVFFDMGNTLVQAEGLPDAWRPAVLEAIERDFGKRWWAEPLYDADIRRPPKGEPHRQETNRWLAEWLRAKGEVLTSDDIERLRVDFARPLPLAYSLTSGAAEALRWCKERQLAVVVVTNTISRGDEQVRNDFVRFNLSDAVDHVITSYSTGWEKPHPAIFDRALACAGLTAAETCMVGDELEADVIGPQRLGMRAVWICRDDGQHAAAAPNAKIGSLLELPVVLETWLRPDLQRS